MLGKNVPADQDRKPRIGFGPRPCGRRRPAGDLHQADDPACQLPIRDLPTPFGATATERRQHAGTRLSRCRWTVRATSSAPASATIDAAGVLTGRTTGSRSKSAPASQTWPRRCPVRSVAPPAQPAPATYRSSDGPAWQRRGDCHSGIRLVRGPVTAAAAWHVDPQSILGRRAERLTGNSQQSKSRRASVPLCKDLKRTAPPGDPPAMVSAAWREGRGLDQNSSRARSPSATARTSSLTRY